MAHKKVTHDIPKQLGFFVLQYAKLRMLEFYYDCLDYYMNRDDYELCQMDTDSIYLLFLQNYLNPVWKATLLFLW